MNRRTPTAETIVAETLVIIPLRGQTAIETLPYSLATISAAGYQRLLIVDAGDSEGLAEILRDWPHEATVHAVSLADRRFSRSRLLNYGASIAQADWIALADADILITRQWAQSGAEFLFSNYAALVAPTVYYMDRGDGARYREDRKSPDPTNPRKRIDCGGGFAWLRRLEFISCGGLDTDFVGWGQEEWDFLWRWKQQGRPIFRPSEMAYHLWHDRKDRKSEGYTRPTVDNRSRFAEISNERLYDLPFAVKGVTPLLRPRER